MAVRIEQPCRVAPTVLAVLTEVGELIAQVVPHDERDLQMYDPESMVPVAAVAGTPMPLDIRLAHCELEQHGRDVAPFRLLARGRPHTITLGRATAGRLQDSRRYRELLAPVGIRHEMRAVFVCQEICWGAMSLFRHGGGDFTGAAQRWVAAIAPIVARGLRRCAVAAPVSTTSPGTGVVLVGPGAPVVPVTAAGEGWLDVLGDALDVQAVASRARRDATATVRLPTAYGWAVLDASRTRNSDDVVVRQAGGPAVMPILAMAYGLTPAQRSVVALVMHGLSGREIGNRLRISEETVRDHLRAAYRKTGTTNSGALRHRLTLDAWTADPG